MVVVSHRPHQWLSACLASVVDRCDELLVVDNGSEGAAVSDLARACGARPLRLPENVGFPGGVNHGVRAATGDVIALLNDDAMAEPGWLPAAIAVLADPSVAAVAPKLLFAHRYVEVRFDDEPYREGDDPRPLGRCIYSTTMAGADVLERLEGGIYRLEAGVRDGVAMRWRWTTGTSPIYLPLEPGWDPADLLIDGAPPPVSRVVDLVNSAGSYLSAEGYGGDYGFRSPDDGAFDVPGERFGACGAAMVTRAETFRHLGDFAASFFAYYEDLDWCWRARLAGLRVWYDPAGVVRHVGGVTSGGPLSRSVTGLAARNRVLCLARNGPMSVLGRQVSRAAKGQLGPVRWRSLARRLPSALVDRRVLARRWTRSPTEVWQEWAGVDERWGADRGAGRGEGVTGG